MYIYVLVCVSVCACVRDAPILGWHLEKFPIEQ